MQQDAGNAALITKSSRDLVSETRASCLTALLIVDISVLEVDINWGRIADAPAAPAVAAGGIGGALRSSMGHVEHPSGVQSVKVRPKLWKPKAT
jgi:hypothetical protein